MHFDCFINSYGMTCSSLKNNNDFYIKGVQDWKSQTVFKDMVIFIFAVLRLLPYLKEKYIYRLLSSLWKKS